MSETSVTKNAEEKILIMERVFEAPRERVWQAWADPAQLAKWWGPKGWETTIKSFEFKPGGVWHYCMKCVDESQGTFFNQESWGKAVYLEIDEPNSITYKDYFSDAEGNIDDSLPETTVAMEFKEENGKTRVVSRSQFETTEGFNKVIEMGVVEGMTQTWDRLEELVTGKPEG